MGNTWNSARKMATDRYLETICPLVEQDDLADFLGAASSSIWRWREGLSVPSKDFARKLGLLAATITFFREELAFNIEETAGYLSSITLDPQTYQPVTNLTQIRDGNGPLVIQRAIELSIVEEK